MSEIITFLLGPEEGLKNEYINKIKAELTKNVGDFETHNYYPFDSDEIDLINLLYDSSLFSTHRLIIIRHYEEVKKDSKTNSDLIEFLKNPTSDVTILVLSTQSSSFGINPKLLGLIDQKKQIEIFYELFDNKKKDWIFKLFKENGLYITDDGINELLDLVDNNTQEIKRSTENLIIFLKSRDCQKITGAEISNFLQHTKIEDSNTLFEAIAEKDLGSSLSILHKILEENRISSASLILNLILKFRQCESYKADAKQGLNDDERFSGMKIIKTSDVIFSTVSRKRDKDAIRTAANNYSEPEIENIIKLLLKLDSNIKELSIDMIPSFWDLNITLIIKKGGKETQKNDIGIKTPFI